MFLPVDRCQRTDYRPGELAQWDLWFPPVDVPLGWGQVGRPPVIVGVSGYSRFLVARMIGSRQTHDVLGGHLACLLALGGVPREGVYDGEAAIGRRRGERVELTEAFQAFRGVLGMGAYVCRPRDPEAKGLVERANGYLETSFLPGRDFAGVDDFNAQLAAWLEREPAGGRGRGPGLGVVSCAGDEVARHRRSLAAHRTITDAAHARAARLLREAATSAAPSHSADVEVRDLADYDRALGVA